MLPGHARLTQLLLRGTARQLHTQAARLVRARHERSLAILRKASNLEGQRPVKLSTLEAAGSST